MPYKIVEQDGEYCVYKKDENDEPVGESLGCHKSRDEAEGQMAALYAAEPGKSVYAVKYIREGELGPIIGGYGILFGTEETPDLSRARDFFDAKTDFMLPENGELNIPMLYDHDARDHIDPPLLGRWGKGIPDHIGVWFEGQVNRAHKYKDAVMELVRRGLLTISTDSATHLVRREPMGKGVHRLVRWPILAASLTTSPAEPRLRPLSEIKSAYKSLGMDLPAELADDADAGASDSDAVRVLQLRARAIMIDLQ